MGRYAVIRKRTVIRVGTDPSPWGQVQSSFDHDRAGPPAGGAEAPFSCSCAVPASAASLFNETAQTVSPIRTASPVT